MAAEPALPEASQETDAFCARYAGGPVPPAELRQLHAWLDGVVPPTSFSEGVAIVTAAVEWLRVGRADVATTATDRLRTLLDALDAEPRWRAAVGRALGWVLQEGAALSFLESGLPNERGLGEETTDRLARLLLPTPRDERDLGGLVRLLFPSLRAAEWIAELPPPLLSAVVALVVDDPPGQAWARLRQALLDAVSLIAVRIAALGLTAEIRVRSPECALANSPFVVLRRHCDAVYEGRGAVSSCREAVIDCRAALQTVLAHLEEFGVSVDVVYRIEVIGFNLDRLDELLSVVGSAGDAAAAGRLVARLSAASIRDRSLRDLTRTNLRLLARKVIERAGETGEHYITTTRGEYLRMLGSAAGGGALTAVTTVFKYLVVWSHLPLFVEGVLSSTNYAASFLLMQLLGFTLATKQPSMIAAALAGSLHGTASRSDLDPLVTTIARSCRSQLAAAVGNIALVIPAALLFHVLYRGVTGHAFLDEATAEHTLQSLHPTQSGTIPFAALTGVFLWGSSLCAGWLENWAVFRRLPEGIARHRLGAVFGAKRMAWAGRTFAHNIAGVGGNVSVGLFLGMAPVVGKFLGVPLEVRHVTLSTGSLTMALCRLGLGAHGIGSAIAGIAIILALNFGVSFALALGVAMRARGVESGTLRVTGAVLARFYRAPLEFVLPFGQD